jgi:hypothetical protein
MHAIGRNVGMVQIDCGADMSAEADGVCLDGER